MLMKTLPCINKVFSLLTQEERQMIVDFGSQKYWLAQQMEIKMQELIPVEIDQRVEALEFKILPWREKFQR